MPPGFDPAAPWRTRAARRNGSVRGRPRHPAGPREPGGRCCGRCNSGSDRATRRMRASTRISSRWCAVTTNLAGFAACSASIRVDSSHDLRLAGSLRGARRRVVLVHDRVARAGTAGGSGRCPGRRRHRGRRVHGAVVGHRAARRGSIPARRRPRGGSRRLGGERAQRRLLRGVADPRPGERAAALPGRDRPAGAGGRREPRRPGAVRPRRGHRLRARGHGDPGRRDRAAPGRGPRGVRGAGGSPRGRADVPPPGRGAGAGPLAAVPGRRPGRRPSGA